MEQEIRSVLAHGGVGQHAAVIGIDAPALPGDIAAPDETDIAPVGRRGAEAADHRFARYVGMRQVAELDPIKNVLSGREIFQHILAVKSLSGRAAIGGNALALPNDSVVATSTIICDGRSARAHTTPPSAPTSPDCTPWVICGRSAARLR